MLHLRASVRAATLAAAVLAAAACAAPMQGPTPPYQQYLSRWNGDTEANLVTAWGVPAKTHVLADGGRIIEYTRAGEADVACTTRFTLTDRGRIVRWWFRGHECLAPVSE